MKTLSAPYLQFYNSLQKVSPKLSLIRRTKNKNKRYATFEKILNDIHELFQDCHNFELNKLLSAYIIIDAQIKNIEAYKCYSDLLESGGSLDVKIANRTFLNLNRKLAYTTNYIEIGYDTTNTMYKYLGFIYDDQILQALQQSQIDTLYNIVRELHNSHIYKNKILDYMLSNQGIIKSIVYFDKRLKNDNFYSFFIKDGLQYVIDEISNKQNKIELIIFAKYLMSLDIPEKQSIQNNDTEKQKILEQISKLDNDIQHRYKTIEVLFNLNDISDIIKAITFVESTYKLSATTLDSEQLNFM